MKASGWPFQTVPGLYIVEQGPVLFFMCNVDVMGEASDIKSFLDMMEDSERVKSANIVVADQGTSVWVPLGFTTVLIGLPADRATVVASKKKGKAKTTVVTEYASVSFLPAIAALPEDLVDLPTVNYIATQLAISAKFVPTSLRSNCKWKEWVEGIEKQAKKTAAPAVQAEE